MQAIDIVSSYGQVVKSTFVPNKIYARQPLTRQILIILLAHQVIKSLGYKSTMTLFDLWQATGRGHMPSLKQAINQLIDEGKVSEINDEYHANASEVLRWWWSIENEKYKEG